MSRIRIGKWEDGSGKYSYFIRRKHRKKRKTLRWVMWIAKQWAMEHLNK